MAASVGAVGIGWRRGDIVSEDLRHHGGSGAHAQLGEDPPEIGGDGPFAEVEPVGNLFVATPLANHHGHLEFTPGQEQERVTGERLDFGTLAVLTEAVILRPIQGM